MNICVYGAASPTIDKSFLDFGEELGLRMAQRGHNLVFGGGGAGMMGAVARGVYKGGTHILGVIPSFFNVDGVLFEHCDEQIFTETMRIRKKTLEDRSDAFIVTPGGVGTYDELFEILTLRSLGRHDKPIVILNLNGYYDKLLDMINYGVEEEFIKEKVMSKWLYVSTDVEDTLNYLESQVK